MANADDTQVITMTGAVASSFVGLKPQRFRQLMKSPFPPPRLGDKTFRSDDLGKWYKAKVIREMRITTTQADSDVLDGAHELARKNRALADRAELDLEIRKGELVEATDVSEVWITALTKTRTRLMAIPSSFAPLIAAEDDIVAVKMMLDEAIREALIELVDDVSTADVDEEIDG